MISVGNIDETGYLKGFGRRGYTKAKCILELIANAIDALDKIINTNKSIVFNIERDYIKIIDGGFGMNKDAAVNMFSMHRENHSNDRSRGVSGIGAKPAQSNLSNQTEVKIYSHTQNGDYICITAPWDKIHKESKYTNMITINHMNENEKKDFIDERNKYNMLTTGTTIKFKYNDALNKLILNNFKLVTSSEDDDDSLKNPLDRIACVFGRDNVNIRMDHYESNEIKIMKMYNYFGEENSKYYTGISNFKIEQYSSINDDRFILKDIDGDKEINKTGVGFSTTPLPLTKNFTGYNLVGEYNVKVGLRVDTKIFDENCPRLLTADKKIHYNSYNTEHIGQDNNDFLCNDKLVRNNQLIGLIKTEFSIGSARADGESHLKIKLIQSDVEFYPISNHDNRQDMVMGIQENKNQFNGEAIPKNFTRLLKSIREKKAKEILNYFNEKIGVNSDSSTDTPNNEKPEEKNNLNIINFFDNIKKGNTAPAQAQAQAAESNAEPESNQAAESESNQAAESESNAEPAPESDADADAAPESESNADAAPESESNADAVPESDADAEPESESNPAPEPESDAAPEPESDAEPESNQAQAQAQAQETKVESSVTHRVPDTTKYVGLKIDACFDGKVNISENGQILYSVIAVGHGTDLKKYFESVKTTYSDEKLKCLGKAMSEVFN